MTSFKTAERSHLQTQTLALGHAFPAIAIGYLVRRIPLYFKRLAFAFLESWK